MRESLRNVVDDLRIVIVDDGSVDGTAPDVTAMARIDPSIKLISFSRSFGKEAALLAGLREATTPLVALMDGDLQHPPEVLLEMVLLQRETGVDQVVGVRARSGEGPLRKLLSRAYARVLASVSDFPLAPGQGDFRVVTSRVVEAVISMSEVNRFNRGLFAWVGFPTLQVEYSDKQRGEGKSRWSPGQLLGYGLDGLLSFSPKPLRFLIVVGAVSMGIFFVYVIIVIVRVLIFGVDTPGYPTLIAAVFFVGGMQAFSIGLLGEYLGRIFLEVKRRPTYIVMDSQDRRDPEL